MQFLNNTECAAWCEARGHRLKGDAGRLTHLRYPTDSGQKVALANSVVHWALAPGSCLIWITEFGVWPSSEHRPLYDRFRHAVGGDDGGLGSSSGHLVTADEYDDAVSVVAMALLFFWDVYVLPDAFGPVFFASHDEYVGVFLPEGPASMPAQFADWLAE